MIMEGKELGHWRKEERAQGLKDLWLSVNSLKALGSPSGENYPWQSSRKTRLGGWSFIHRHLQQQGQYGGSSAGTLQAAGHCLKVIEEEKKEKRKTEGGGRERERDEPSFLRTYESLSGDSQKNLGDIQGTKFLQLWCRDSELSIFRYW